MNPKLILSILASLLLVGCANLGHVADNDAEGQGDQYDLYLLIGQSNMAGRGVVGQTDQTPHEHVFMLGKAGIWLAATDPVHFDKPEVVGVGPGLSFGKTIACYDQTRKIGLIPAAVGGSSIASWKQGGFHKQTGSHPYDDAISRARIAMKNGTLKGILWHQGEADSNAEKLPVYKSTLTKMAASFRRDLGSPDVPFIVGGLGDFFEQRHPQSAEITAILRDAPGFISNTGFVSARGLSHKGDGVHFSAQSARDLGGRYARKLLEMREDRPNQKLSIRHCDNLK